MKYYSIKLKKNNTGRYAYFIEDIDFLNPEFLYQYITTKVVRLKFKHLEFREGEIEISNDIPCEIELWTDTIPTCFGSLLFSSKAVDVFNNYISIENIKWIRTLVEFEELEIEYYLLSFLQKNDVLDMKATTFLKSDPDHIINPVVCLDKILFHNIFCIPRSNWQMPSHLIISDALKKEILRKKLTGITFEQFKDIY